MIPLRVTMSGWMRYRDEQTADFTGARLIAIVGDNGAGKSSIFDAMTFALYGSHRLGRVNTDQLISQGADLLSVAFEFEVGGQKYRVERTAGRRSADGRRAFYFLDIDSGEWKNVPGSERKELLDQQIAAVVRMSEAAFTSSFLLQQGEATQFLDARPAARFGIISSLIGIDAYERLHARVNAWHKETKGALDQLKTLLQGYDGVDAAHVAALESAREVAASALADARVAASAATQRATAAASYAALAREITELDAAIAEADTLIEQREAIERDASTFRRLEQDLATVALVRDELAAAARASQQASRERAAAEAIDIAAAERAAVDALAVAAAADKAREEAITAQTVAQDAAAAAALALAAAESLDAAQRTVAECAERIAAFDVQLAGADGTRAERDRLAAITDAMPHLRGLREAFDVHEKAAASDPEATVSRRQAEIAQIEADAQALRTAVAAADVALQSAQRDSAAAAASVSTLTAELAERESAAKEATCSRCGQPIDRKRAQAEIAELKRRLTAATADAKDADAAVSVAEKAAATARREEATSTEHLQAAQLALSRAQDAVSAVARAAVHIDECRVAARAASPSDIAAVTDAATSAAEVVALIGGFRDVPQRLKSAQKALDGLQQIAGERAATVQQRDTASNMLAELRSRAGDGIAELKQARADDAAARAAADAARKASLAASEAARAASERATTAAAAQTRAREARAAHETAAATAAADAAGHRRAAEARAAALPEGQRDQALTDADGFLRELTAGAAALADAPARLAALEEAAQRRTVAATQRADRAAAADAIVPAYRVDPIGARRESDAAASAAASAEGALKAVEADASRAAERLSAAENLRASHDAQARRLKHLARLRTMLSRRGLQAVLVRDALVTITSHANGFLQRLTGGSLQLILRQAEGSEALDLRAVDATCMTEPVDVLALSGSQKFRCAVAIASGIGQFVGAGGMRSIVIDEGFSSLDEQSQAQMVDELKQLANHMEKVIVVSHLEPYKDPVNFPDQIRIEGRDGRSVIQRIT